MCVHLHSPITHTVHEHTLTHIQSHTDKHNNNHSNTHTFTFVCIHIHSHTLWRKQFLSVWKNTKIFKVFIYMCMIL